jgi:hypothetical protein
MRSRCAAFGTRAPASRAMLRATEFGLYTCYRGALGATNCELIQPFKRLPSTWTQSPSRLVTLKRAPLGAVPRTVPFADGVDLMFTPGRCRKTVSRFCAAGTVWRAALFPAGAAEATWGEGSTLREGGRSGQATAAGSGDGRGTAWTGAAAEDCTGGAESAVCVTCSPAGAKKKYASAPGPNTATSAVPAISFRPDRKLVSVSAKSICSGGWKGSSPIVRDSIGSWRRTISPAAGVPAGARGGAQKWLASRLLSANPSPFEPWLAEP